MKKEYQTPLIAITCFNTENVITASVTAINDVAAMARGGNLSVGGQKLAPATEILSFKF